MKKFWTFIKHKRSDVSKIPPLKSNGTLHSEPTDKADILNGQFQKAFSDKTTITEKEFKEQCNMPGKSEQILDINITENGVYKLLNNLHPNKAAWPEKITPR
ncbi:Hypothetical predicted protein, partial [Mytilus galloprovincialis]